MNFDVVSSVLVSLGGATVIIGAFANFLGKIWTDRILNSVQARYKIELENIKSKNIIELENFKHKSSIALDEKSQFGLISVEFYQDFFKQRINTYLKLLEIKNEYISNMEEDFMVDIHEKYGDVYYHTYESLRELIVKNQLYISNELDQKFNSFRSLAAKYLVRAEYADITCPEDHHTENHQLSQIYTEFASETSECMNEVMDQIGNDIRKFRARIELDKA